MGKGCAGHGWAHLSVGERVGRGALQYLGESVGATTPVDRYPQGASPYGLLDMAGNVWEWTRSLYKPYPYDPQDGREDLGATGPRVVRGGSWYHDVSYARCAYRNS